MHQEFADTSLTRILFICHGNICRSPMAEFIMKDLVAKSGLSERYHVESAATSTEEIGSPVYPPAKRLLDRAGIDCSGKRARQVRRSDLLGFDYLVLMDGRNVRNMEKLFSEEVISGMMRLSEDGLPGPVSLLSEWSDKPDFKGNDIADPWYTRDFNLTWEEISEGCRSMLVKLEKRRKYSLLLREAKALLEGENDGICAMANISAAIQARFGFLWCGFYRVKDSQLVLGPFQGPVACTRIGYGKGVCGTAWKEERTVTVPDVELFPGHIRCSSSAVSEIVVPVRRPDGTIAAVLDIDSSSPATFGPIDEYYLPQITALLAKVI